MSLKQDLEQFYGTETYTRFCPFFKRIVATDGVIFLAENGKAFWLLEVIVSYLPRLIKAQESFAVASLKKSKSGGGAMFRLDNGNDKASGMRVQYAQQHISLTDFPFDQLGNEFKLFIEVGYLPAEAGAEPTPHYVVMLPQER